MKIEVINPEQFKTIWRETFHATATVKQIYYTRSENGIEARFTDGAITFILIVDFDQMRNFRIGPEVENPEFLPEDITGNIPDGSDPSVSYDSDIIWDSFKREFLPKAIEIANFVD